MNEQDRNAQLGGNLAESLLQVNKLAYRMPPQLSIASNRTIQTMFSNQSVYTPSNTIIFDVQSGSAFVDPYYCVFCSYAEESVMTIFDILICIAILAGAVALLFIKAYKIW